MACALDGWVPTFSRAPGFRVRKLILRSTVLVVRVLSVLVVRMLSVLVVRMLSVLVDRMLSRVLVGRMQGLACFHQKD